MRGTQKIGKSRDHKGVGIYWYKKDPTPGAEKSQRPPSVFDRVYTSSSAPCVKELPPQGGNSYDQIYTL
jgi:hypothetical protein